MTFSSSSPPKHVLKRIERQVKVKWDLKEICELKIYKFYLLQVHYAESWLNIWKKKLELDEFFNLNINMWREFRNLQLTFI